jgi:hypothetical protein
VVFVCGESRGMDARFAAYFLFPPRAIFLSVAGTDRGAHAPEIFFVHSAWPSCTAHGEPPVCSVGPDGSLLHHQSVSNPTVLGVRPGLSPVYSWL